MLRKRITLMCCIVLSIIVILNAVPKANASTPFQRDFPPTYIGKGLGFEAGIGYGPDTVHGYYIIHNDGSKTLRIDSITNLYWYADYPFPLNYVYEVQMEITLFAGNMQSPTRKFSAWTGIAGGPTRLWDYFTLDGLDGLRCYGNIDLSTGIYLEIKLKLRSTLGDMKYGPAIMEISPLSSGGGGGNFPTI